MKKPNRLLRTISVMLMAFAALITMAMIGGCASGTSDRGNLGETAAAPMIQVGQIDNTGQPMPAIGIDKETGWYTAGFEVVKSELDAQIAELQTALVTAQEATDTAAVKDITEKIAALQTMKTSVAAMKGGGAKNSIVYIGSLTLTTSGTSSAASPGDTTQTPSTQTTPTATVDLTP